MANVILVAGTHHGGWYWESFAEKLRTFGHQVFTPTLSGLDDSVLSDSKINLDTHIQDILQLIKDQKLESFSLVGWSYAGMVITGAADRTMEHVNSLIFLDACVPNSGQSEWDLISENLKKLFTSSTRDGLNIDVPEVFLKFRPRLMPHPLATKLQPVIFSEEKFNNIPKIYVHAQSGVMPGDPSVFSNGYKRALNELNWSAYSLPVGHDLVSEDPDSVLEIILNHI